MKLRLRVNIWILALLGACSMGVGAEPDPNGDLVQLRQYLDSMSSLQGDFTQVLYDADGTLLEESSGDFRLQRPGKFYWHTREPFEQLLVSDQEHIWLYDPDLEQVTVRPYEDQVNGSPALILSDDLDGLGDKFAVQRRSENDGHDSFALTPRADEELFQELVLVFVDQQLSEIRMRDNLDQLTVFSLNDLRLNQTIDSRLFEFEPPEGVDVLVD